MNSSKDVVVERLDALIRLTETLNGLQEMSNRLAALAACGDRTQKEKITLLNSVGFPPKAIAELLGTTRNSVSVALTGIRKEPKGKMRKKHAAAAEG